MIEDDHRVTRAQGGRDPDDAEGEAGAERYATQVAANTPDERVSNRWRSNRAASPDPPAATGLGVDRDAQLRKSTIRRVNAYTTWGKPTTATHNGIADLGFRFLHVGAADVQWDSAYGLDLLYMHARHYSPGLGRFLQPDPGRLDTRLFAYSGNSPVSKADWTGEVAVPLAWCAIPLIGWGICSTAVRLMVARFSGSLTIASGAALTPISSKIPLAITITRDSLSRVISASATVTRATLRTGTSASQAARSWCCNGQSIYEAGHLIAKVFGGPGGLKSGNIVAMLKTLNRSDYKRLENTILRLVENGAKVEIKVVPYYSGTGTTPVGVLFQWRTSPWQAFEWKYFAN